MKISRAKTKGLEFRLKNEVKGNGSDDNVRFGGQLTDKVKIFEYLQPVI